MDGGASEGERYTGSAGSGPVELFAASLSLEDNYQSAIRAVRDREFSLASTNAKGSASVWPTGDHVPGAAAVKRKLESPSEQQQLPVPGSAKRDQCSYGTACAVCRRLKAKCDGLRPCSRCVRCKRPDMCKDR